MAKYATDFTEYTAGGKPSDWTLESSGNDDFLIRSEMADPRYGGKCLYRSVSSRERDAIVCPLPESVDAHVIAAVRYIDYKSTSLGLGPCARLTGTSRSDVSAVMLQLRSGEAQLGHYINGSYSNIATESFTPDLDRTLWMELLLEGGEAKARYWYDNEDKPEAWNLSGASALNQPGKLGLFGFTDAPNSVHFFAASNSPAADGFGLGEIQGHVTEAGEGVSRKVRVYRADNGHPVAEGLSEADGSYRLSEIPQRTGYFVHLVPDEGEEPRTHGPVWVTV